MKTIQFLHSLLCWSKYTSVKTLIKILVVLISVVVVMGSCSNDKILKEKLETLYSSPVVFTTSGLLYVDNPAYKNKQGKTVKARYTLLVYNGAGECSVCAMGKMSEWNALLNLEKEGLINLVFIFSPSKMEKEKLITAYYSSGLEHSILIDTCGVFPEQNPQISQESVFHTLLLDSTGNVVLVGDPLKNSKIKELYHNILTAR